MEKTKIGICIETERLILRQFCQDDATSLQKICNEPHILKWMPDWKSSIDQFLLEKKG